MLNKFLRLLAAFLVGILFYQLPIPPEAGQKGWALLSIFIGTMVAIILKPYPVGAITLMSLLVASLTGTLNLIKEGLTGYSSNIIWLVVYVFFIARGFIKTQLGSRIAYFFVSILGRHSIGLAYGVLATELFTAPIIPSNAARAGGIVYPILKSIAEALGSRTDDGTEKKIGRYLVQVGYHGNLITSAMFVTAMAANPMVQSLAAQNGIDISFLSWLWAACVPGITSLLLLPLIIYKLDPPELSHLSGATDLAKQRLKAMGPMSRQETFMAFTFGLMLFLWIAGEKFFGVDATTTALLGLTLLILSGILQWEDILKEKEAWHTLIWFAVLIGMAGFLQKFGVVTWFSNLISSFVVGFPWYKAFFILVLVYFYSHYFFASNTAHVSAMYAAFLSVSLLAGTPPLLAALVLGFCGSLFSSMTHYGSSSAVVLFGSGYVPVSTWWFVGFIISVINLFIWLGIGGFWWKAIGLW